MLAPGGSRLRTIGARLSILPALALGLAILAYVSVGAGGAAGAIAILITFALVAIGLLRARKDPEQAAVVDRVGSRALLLLPGLALAFLAYNAGGFFPGPPSLVTLILALILAARLALGSPVDLGRLVGAVVVALAAYAAWVLLSGSWSRAPERAVTEADLALLYGLGFVLFATSVAGAGDLRWVMRGIALGSFLVCLGAFLSRSLPRVWSIAPGLDTPRLSYPVTYWNVLGLIAVVGIVLCVGLTSDEHESRLLRALSAMALPLLAVTLLLTFSRGAIGAALIALVAFVLLGRPRLLASAALAFAPGVAVAVVVAYGATSLARPIDGSALQTSEGRRVALVVAVCALAVGLGRWLLGWLDVRIVRLAERRPLSPATARGLWAAAIGLVVVALVVLGLPGAVARQYHGFITGEQGVTHGQLRDRLVDPGANGRVDLWRVALREFDGAPAAGTGAGTFEVVWAARRPPLISQAIDAHSVYLENLGELGVVGFGLLVAVVLGSLVGVARRIRGPQRTLYAAVFAAALAWTVHAGLDWDWEMPALTLPVFALAGAALARHCSTGTAPLRHRPLLALGVLAVAVLPALVNVSQSHLDASLAAFARGDCAAAATAARSSLSLLSFRRGAHEILAYCHAARRERAPALTEMATAVRDDPQGWEPRYGLAIVQAAVRADPRPAARAALTLNPYEPVVVDAAAQFRTGSPARWAAQARAAPLPVSGQYGAELANLGAGPSR